jgi:hypothetical protein
VRRLPSQRGQDGTARVGPIRDGTRHEPWCDELHTACWRRQSCQRGRRRSGTGMWCRSCPVKGHAATKFATLRRRAGRRTLPRHRGVITDYGTVGGRVCGSVATPLEPHGSRRPTP